MKIQMVQMGPGMVTQANVNIYKKRRRKKKRTVSYTNFNIMHMMSKNDDI